MLGALEQKYMNWKHENTEQPAVVVAAQPTFVVDESRYQIHMNLSSWPKIDEQMMSLSLHLQDQLLL